MGCAQSAPERQQVQPAAAAVKSQPLMPISTAIRPSSPVLVSTMSKVPVSTNLVLDMSMCVACQTDPELDRNDWCQVVAVCNDCTPPTPLCKAHLGIHALKRAFRQHRTVSLVPPVKDDIAEVAPSEAHQSEPVAPIVPANKLHHNSSVKSVTSPLSYQNNVIASAIASIATDSIACAVHPDDSVQTICIDCRTLVCMMCVLDSRTHGRHRTLPLLDLINRQRGIAESFSTRNRVVSAHAADIQRRIEEHHHKVMQSLESTHAALQHQIRAYENSQLQYNAACVSAAEQNSTAIVSAAQNPNSALADSESIRLIISAATAEQPRLPTFQMNFVADASIYSTSGRTAPLVALTGRVVVNGIDHSLCELSLPASGAVATVDREFVTNLTLRDSRGLAAGDDINWNDSASGSASDGVTNVISFGGTVEIEAFLARSSGQRVCGAMVKATSQPGRLRVSFVPTRSLLELSPLMLCVNVNGQAISHDAPMIAVQALGVDSQQTVTVAKAMQLQPATRKVEIAPVPEPLSSQCTDNVLVDIVDCDEKFLAQSAIIKSDDRAMRTRMFQMLDCVAGFPRIHARQLLSAAGRCSASAFDSAVRDRGATLTIIQSAGGHVFGAYIQDALALRSSSNSIAGWAPGSADSFVFALGNLTKAPLRCKRVLQPNSSAVSAGDGIYQGGCGLHAATDLVAFCSHSCQPSLYTRSVPAKGFESEIVALKPGTLCGTPGVDTYELAHVEVYAISNAP